MAYTESSVTSLANALSVLDTFLSGQGWTTHYSVPNKEFAADKNPSGSDWITFAMQWDTNYAGVYQWHGNTYNSGANPYNQNNDSGSGYAGGTYTDANLDDQRRVNFTNVDYLWVFEDTNYWHAVIRRTGSPNIYEHFGAGLLDKFNDWVGGEYCYGHVPDATFTTTTAIRTSASMLLDGLSADESPSYTNMEERCATMHIDGMAEQTLAGEIWSVVMGNQNSANLGTDRAGNDRIHVLGGFRGGLLAPPFGQFAGTVARGLVPGYPIVLWYWNRTNGHVYGPLGQMPDVRGVSVKNYTAEQQITVGGDTWVVFPSHRRLDGAAASAAYTNLQGIAYKQVA